MHLPPLLSPGDKVALVALSGPCTNREQLAGAVAALTEMGLEVEVKDSCFAMHPKLSYLAGEDKLRLDDLHDVFFEKSIKGVFAARGGYGVGRLLPYIDFEIIKQNPKVLVGFSDVTALHTAINQQAGLITFHGQMPYNYFGGAEYYKLLFDNKPLSFINLQALYPGECAGITTGGNLSVITSMLGTPYEIDTKGRILILEDINEPLYKIDRMLLQLKLAGKLKDAAGIIFGDMSGLGLNELYPVLKELVLDEKKPTLWGLQCGHIKQNFTVPLGAAGEISAGVFNVFSSRSLQAKALRQQPH